MESISTRAMFAEPTLIVSDTDEATCDKSGRFTLDTTFVLFFLAMDIGSSSLGWTSILSFLTLGAFVVLPYVLPFNGDRESFGTWLAGRIVVAIVGGTFGAMLGQAVGTVLPEVFAYLPMTLLIVAAIICCNVQIYGILKYRLAR